MRRANLPAKRKRRSKWTGDPLRPASERGETLLTKREAANYLGVRERWLNSAAARGIPYTKIGGYVRFRKADLDAYIESQRVPAKGG
jgi:excisionase family DNA binding protein